MVSLMTALWFAHLQAPDRVSVKPHASPVLHAINVLLGRLDPATSSACASTAACSPTRRGRRIPTPSTTRRGRWASGPWRRSGARSPTATWPGTSTFPSAGGRSRCSATPSSTRGRCGRPWPTRWCRAWARSCGWSTSTASPWTGSCRTSPSGRLADMFTAAGWHVETVKYGRAPARARRGRAGPRRRHGQRGVPAAAARRRGRGTGAVARGRRRLARATSPSSTTPRCWRRCATSAATISAPCSGLPGLPTRWPTAPRSSSPTRSRAGGSPSRATPATTPRCSPRPVPGARRALGTDPRTRGAASPSSAKAELCAAAAARLARPPVPLRAPPPAPAATTRRHTGSGSTQQALGRLLLDLFHEAPEVAPAS